MPKFRHDDYKIIDLIADIESGKLRLPCFQRAYKWNPPRVKSLINSLQHEYPAGSLLFLEVGDKELIPSEQFRYTNPDAFTNNVKFQVLDGQQRITSCYCAFGNPSTAYYTYFLDYIKMHELYKKDGEDASYDFEELVVHKRHTSSPFNDMKDGLFPLCYVLDRKILKNKIATYISSRAEDMGDTTVLEQCNFLQNQFQNIIDPIIDYQFPVIQLKEDISMEAVCKVFQTINTTGLKLSVFDICTAVFFPQGINLKEKVAKAIEDHKAAQQIIEKDPTIILQVIALLANKKPNTNTLAGQLDASDITDYWEKAVTGIDQAMERLDVYGAGTKKNLSLLPYTPVVPVMAAILARKEYSKLTESQKSAVSNKLKTFFYHVALSLRYTEGTNNKICEDFQSLLLWLSDADKIPAIIAAGVDWNTDKMISSNKGSAFGKGILCMLNSRHPKDFYNDKSVGIGEHVPDSCDLHHLFPKAEYTTEYGEITDSVFNFTWLTKDTNIFISDKTTKKYLKEIIDSCGVTEESLKSNLRVHAISEDMYELMKEEKYYDFLKERALKFKKYFEKIGIVFNEVASEAIDEENYETEENDE